MSVTEGQAVGVGDIIGAVGATGNADGDHLHFEVRLGEVQVDPVSYLTPIAPSPLTPFVAPSYPRKGAIIIVVQTPFAQLAVASFAEARIGRCPEGGEGVNNDPK